jgi:hypothetical protein
MKRRYCIRLFRIYLFILAVGVLVLWIIPSIIFQLNREKDDIIEYYEHFLDNHVYPPPWYISNWTIDDYFIRKDNFKNIDDQYAIDKKQKIIIKNGLSNEKKLNYTILEYTTVFNKPKFCGKTQDFIFGKQCPYQNCR